MQIGSSGLQRLVASMMKKAFLERPMVARLTQDAWFKSSESGRPLDLQALNLLKERQTRTDLYRALLADVAAHRNLAQLGDLNDLFMKLDVNNDGLISAPEIRQALASSWRAEDIERLIASLVGNDGGEVSYDTFMGELMAAKRTEENGILQDIFREADKQNRGYLGPAEVAQLAQGPAVVKMLGSRGPDDLLREMDLDGNGRVTFDEFRQAMQGVGRRNAGMAVRRYQKGQPVQFWSKSHSIWVACKILDVDAASGAVQVDCKAGCWIHGEDLHRLIKAPGADTGYRVGQGVLYYSTSYSTWVPCKVTEVDEVTGAVQIDQKPNYWLRGNELHTRLKQAGDQPPARGAAKAGVGRQLFHAALQHVGKY